MSESARITELETRLAFLEHALDGVSLAVLELEKARALQQREMMRLRDRMTEFVQSAGASHSDPPPPHY